MSDTKLDKLKALVLKQSLVEKDRGFEVDLRFGIINFLELLRYEKQGKLDLIQTLINKAEDPATLSLLHEAYWDVEHQNI